MTAANISFHKYTHLMVFGNIFNSDASIRQASDFIDRVFGIREHPQDFLSGDLEASLTVVALARAREGG